MAGGYPPPPPRDIIIRITGRYFLTSRQMNKLQRSKNGNGIISIAHWNAGARHWQRKLIDLELLIQELAPDLLYISEANLYSTTPDWERQLRGYKLVTQGSMDKDGYARIVLLVRE